MGIETDQAQPRLPFLLPFCCLIGGLQSTADRRQEDLRSINDQMADFSRIIQRLQAEVENAKKQVGWFGCYCLDSLLLGGGTPQNS